MQGTDSANVRCLGCLDTVKNANSFQIHRAYTTVSTWTISSKSQSKARYAKDLVQLDNGIRTGGSL